jgi:predicted RNA-binding protein YlxR (DUF448 family)
VRLALVDGTVVVDEQAQLPGRGAYVCSTACARQAMRRKALGRAFRRAVEAHPDHLQWPD